MSEESLRFHIQENDCLGTLATVVDQVSQSLKKRGQSLKKRSASSEIAALARVRDQLLYLQQHYTLEEVAPYCPLTVHYRRASGRHAGIKETGKNVEGVSPTPRKYWGL